MRKSEITPELRELSKRAKELGFPQYLQEGDWYWCDSDQWCYVIDELSHEEEQAINDSYYPRDFLILTFSRCLAWLEKERYPKMLGMTLEFNNWIRGHWILSSGTKSYRGENIHEAIAKAVVKILEEPKEGRGERQDSLNIRR